MAKSKRRRIAKVTPLNNLPAAQQQASRSHHRGLQRTISAHCRYSALGFDPGQCQLKLAQVVRQKNGLLSPIQASLPTPAALFEKGQLQNPAMLGACLKKLLGQASFAGRKVNITLGPPAFELALLALPPIKKRDLEKVMALEAEKRFAGPPEDLIFAWCPLEKPAENKEAKGLKGYLLAAASKEQSRAYHKAVRSAGLKLSVTEVLPLSLLRSPASLSGQNSSFFKGCGLVLDLGHRSSAMIIFNNEELAYYRTLRLSAISFKQEEHSYADFLAAVEQSLQFWLEQPAGKKLYPKKLFLCGGGAYLKGLAQATGQRFKLKPELFNPVAALFDQNNNPVKQNGLQQAIFAAAYGAALRGWLK